MGELPSVSGGGLVGLGFMGAWPLVSIIPATPLIESITLIELFMWGVSMRQGRNTLTPRSGTYELEETLPLLFFFARVAFGDLQE